MRTFIMLLALVLFSPVGFSVTIYVPGQYSTIQDAINAANNGDTIIVKPGIYVENIDFIGKAITVKSEQGPDVTVIDGGNPADPNFGSVVSFRSKENSASILEGFTITNGTGTWFVTSSWSGYVGGGISCRNGSSPIISNNVIKKNKALDPLQNSGGGGIDCEQGSSPRIENNIITENESNWGGGIEAIGSSPKVIHNVISENTTTMSGCGILTISSNSEILNNTITNNSGGYSGGIQLEFGSPIVRNNTVSGNKAIYNCGGIRCWTSDALVDCNIITNNSASWGGGMETTHQDYSLITNNIIAMNSATHNGGGLRCNESEPIVENNLIYANTAVIGGGLDIWQTSFATVTSNTIFGNSATYGGGLACRKDSTAVVTNTIFWDNNATQGPEFFIESYPNPSTIKISYSDVEGGQGSAFVEPGCTLDWGAGMIVANPQFVDSTNGDFHLTYPSPCRGTGDNAAVTLSTDFEGDPRIASGTVDMGADEFHTHLYYTGDATPGGTVALKFVDVPGTTPVGFWIAFNVLATPIPGAYGDWWLLPPMLGPIPLPPIPASGVQVLAGPLPASPPGPYTFYMQAIMGTPLKLSNLCTMNVE